MNDNKILIGIAMIMMNLGSRYVVGDLSKIQEKIVTNSIFKKAVIVCIFFIAVRDIAIALLLSFVYMIIFDGMLNEKKRYYIISQNNDIVKKYMDVLSLLNKSPDP